MSIIIALFRRELRSYFATPVAYALPRGEREFSDYVSNWIVLVDKNGFLQTFYDQWILGRNPARREPRWSVVRDVLEWID